jgi:hypothetical protein
MGQKNADWKLKKKCGVLEAQRIRVGNGAESQTESGNAANPCLVRFPAIRGQFLLNTVHVQRECIGIELPQNPQEKPHSTTKAAQKAAHALADPDLAALIAAWQRLPEPIKAGILALIRAANA